MQFYNSISNLINENPIQITNVENDSKSNKTDENKIKEEVVEECYSNEIETIREEKRTNLMSGKELNDYYLRSFYDTVFALHQKQVKIERLCDHTFCVIT